MGTVRRYGARERHWDHLREFLERRSGERGHDLDGLDLQFVELKPRDQLVVPGPAHEFTYVVVSGLLRLCVHDENGGERAIMFYGPGQMVALVGALKPTWARFGTDATLARLIQDSGRCHSPFCIDAVTPSSVLQLPAEQLAERMDRDLQWAKVAVHQTSITAAIMEQHLLDLLLLSREQHYRKIVAELPELRRVAKARDIASLLGVTPESLSRIRARIARQDAAESGAER